MKILIPLVGSLALTGCFPECVPKIKIVEKIVYVKQTIPTATARPTPMQYNSSVIEYNDEKYYQLSIKDGKVLKNNYEAMSEWADSLHKMLNKLKESE